MDATEDAREQNEFTVADGSRIAIVLDRAETDGNRELVLLPGVLSRVHAVLVHLSLEA